MIVCVRNEDLKVGDLVVMWCGRARITRVVRYSGPLRDIIFATAEVDTGRDFSLERRGWTDVEVAQAVAEIQEGA